MMVWNKIKWLVERFLDFRRKGYPLTAMGVTLLIATVPFKCSSVVIDFPENNYIESLELTCNDESILTIPFSIFIVLIGSLMIWFELRSFARTTSRVLITGMPGLSSDFPMNILNRREQKLAREPVELGLVDVTNDNLSDHIDLYNAELRVDLFKRLVLHQDCTKLYIGGLTRVPMLVAYGAFLRNVSSKVTYFDKLHKEGDWHLLNDEDADISFSDFNFIKKPNEHGDVGLAVGFSSEILEEQLPERYQGYTTILKPSTQEDRNLVKNQDNLERLGMDIKRLIDQLNNSEVLRVHLFLSVQSTLAIEIGRRFQEGMHRNWVIHNFDAQSGKYSSAIELNKNGISMWAP